jgi:2-methylcitrate dehydratase PrpD
VAQAQRCLVDLIGVAAAAAARRRRPSPTRTRHAAPRPRSRRAHLFDGRRAGLAGAAFAGASTIDALDAHDGHVFTKGHAAPRSCPHCWRSSTAQPASRPRAIDGREFLTCLVLGYEIATRAGMALHASVADYHCSGAWNALGCAAVAARLLRFDPRDPHALGVAEYFGPRGQILRACDSPTMVKDGSGWGAHVGVTAALLARDGFTGAPALTIERADARALWDDLGTRWRIREQYFKAYPVCRWRNRQSRRRSRCSVRIASRRRTSPRCRSTASGKRSRSARPARWPRRPKRHSTACRFPVAAALVFGDIGPAEVSAPRLADPRVARLQRVMTLTEDSRILSPLPAERWARVRIALSRRPHARLRAGACARQSREPARRRRARPQVFRLRRAGARRGARGANRAGGATLPPIAALLRCSTTSCEPIP